MTTTRVVVMGVSGCGKSTVGALLAEYLGARFIDGDDLHPKANKDKMAAGTPLNDEDRWPWLDLVGAADRVQLACPGMGIRSDCSCNAEAINMGDDLGVWGFFTNNTRCGILGASANSLRGCVSFYSSLLFSR